MTQPPKHRGSAGSSMPLVGSFFTSDERVLTLTMLATEKYWESALDALEARELLAEFDDASRRSSGAAEIRARLEKQSASRPLAHWVERLAERGCIHAKFASPSEVLEDPQVETNGYEPRHPTHPRARLASSPVQFDEQPIEVRRPAPDRGQHTDELLEALGVGSDEREALRKAGAIA